MPRTRARAARSSELSRCGTSRLECALPVYLRSTSIHTYLLTYLLWSGTGPKTEGAGREKIRWSGAGVGARVAPSRERIAVSGVTERGVSGEQKFPPLLLRSHHMLWSVSEITCSWHSTVLACDVLWVTSLFKSCHGIWTLVDGTVVDFDTVV